jgi:hypothetical protein
MFNGQYTHYREDGSTNVREFTPCPPKGGT